MNKKLFLSLLPVCLIFCLNLTSCDDDFKKESVPGLWEQLKNTAWTMEKTIKVDGVDNKFTFTIGFYGPRNGPEPKSGSDYSDTIYNEVYDYWKYPYVEIRITSSTGRYYFTELSRLKISRTGTISESRSDAYHKYMSEDATNHGWKYEKAFMRSFDVSVSDNMLTISNVKMRDNRYGDSPSSWDKGGDDEYYNLDYYTGKINGKYSYYRYDPNFTFDEGQQQAWSQLRNTTWTKQGESKPSIGFYELNAGPTPVNTGEYEYYSTNYFGYVFFMTPDGTYRVHLSKGSKDGVYFSIGIRDNSQRYGNFSFNIAVSDNKLTILNIRLSSHDYDPETGGYKKIKFRFNDSLMEYTEEELGACLNGTYTKASSDSNYDWSERRVLLWNKINNTAWTKQGESLPSIGFYTYGNGPANFGFSENYGYVYFMTPDGVNAHYFQIIDYYDDYNDSGLISLNGNSIMAVDNNYKRVNFNIYISDNNTITISNIRLSFSYNDEIGSYQKNKFRFFNNVSYLSYMTAEYTEEELGAYFNGTYTIASSEPNYGFDDGQQQVWSQIKNTAWTRQGSSEPSVGFYEWDKGPEPEYAVLDPYGYVYFMTPDGVRKISFSNCFNKSGNYITIDDSSICKLNVTNNTITISNMNQIREYRDGISFYDYFSSKWTHYSNAELDAYFSGTYSKTTNYDWDKKITNLWNQIKNTAWTKQGDSKPTIGFYEKNKGPSGDPDYDGYVYYKKLDGTYFLPGRFTIYRNNNNRPSISTNGDEMVISLNGVGDLIFDIVVSGNTLTISNIRQRNGDPLEEWYSGYLDYNGTYTKTSSDPNYSWN